MIYGFIVVHNFILLCSVLCVCACSVVCVVYAIQMCFLSLIMQKNERKTPTNQHKMNMSNNNNSNRENAKKRNLKRYSSLKVGFYVVKWHSQFKWKHIPLHTFTIERTSFNAAKHFSFSTQFGYAFLVVVDEYIWNVFFCVFVFVLRWLVRLKTEISQVHWNRLFGLKKKRHNINWEPHAYKYYAFLLVWNFVQNHIRTMLNLKFNQITIKRKQLPENKVAKWHMKRNLFDFNSGSWKYIECDSFALQLIQCTANAKPAGCK